MYLNYASINETSLLGVGWSIKSTGWVGPFNIDEFRQGPNFLYIDKLKESIIFSSNKEREETIKYQRTVNPN